MNEWVDGWMRWGEVRRGEIGGEWCPNISKEHSTFIFKGQAVYGQ